MSWKDEFIEKFAWDQFDDELFEDDYDSSRDKKDLEDRVDAFNKESVMNRSPEEAMESLKRDLIKFDFMAPHQDFKELHEKISVSPKMRIVFDVMDRRTETSIPLTVQWNWRAVHPYCIFLINAHQIH